ncbi:MAG: SIS domain-containing protein [Planctomycetes bacterium]|nr:SIS domain-containing protein [Planctomycetota bacterium]
MAGNICTDAAQYFKELATLSARVDPAQVDALTEALYQAWDADQQVIVFGNGGSAYTASHFITDMVKTATVPGHRRLRAISLCDNYGLTTAIGNDITYDDTFVYPLQAYGRPGDLAIAISGSGNSPNVVRACQYARDNGLTLACLTGFKGGKIGPMGHIHINVPTENYGILEDLHLSVGHIITQAFKSRLLAMPVS